MNLHRRLLLVVLAATLPLALVACSLPADEQVSPIDADELGDLADPTTTTTVAPTTSTTTLPPDPAASEPTTTTTTLPELPSENLRLFYTIGATDDMFRLVLEYPSPIFLPAVIQALESPRPEVGAGGLRTAVRPGLIAGYELDRVTLNVSLDSNVLNAMTEEQLRRAIGQIVLTFTSFTPPDTGSIGFVSFFVDGAPIAVFLPATQSSSEIGAPVGFDDFRPLLGDTPVVPASTPTTAATTAPATTQAPVTAP